MKIGDHNNGTKVVSTINKFLNSPSIKRSKLVKNIEALITCGSFILADRVLVSAATH